MTNLMDLLSRSAFAIGSAILMLLAIWLALYAIADVIAAFTSSWRDAGDTALSAIGYVVIALATFDVAKYFIEEEVIRGREMRSAAEARRSLTKFVSTIVIAIFIEALVVVFRVSKDRVAEMIYPTALLLVAIAIVVGLGLFQKMSAQTEVMIEARDRKSKEDEEKENAGKAKSGRKPAAG